jgi:hypothetical protein
MEGKDPKTGRSVGSGVDPVDDASFVATPDLDDIPFVDEICFDFNMHADKTGCLDMEIQNDEYTYPLDWYRNLPANFEKIQGNKSANAVK